jgi:hypothetical protein
MMFKPASTTHSKFTGLPTRQLLRSPSLSPEGWYTIGGQDTVATGVAIEPVLAALLTATVGGVWGVVVNLLLGTFQFQTPAAGGSGYFFNFTSASRCNDFLGFNKLVYLAVNDVIVGSKPFHLTRTLQIVMHTDIQPAFPQCILWITTDRA